MPRSRRDRPPPRVPRPLTCAPHNPSGNVPAAVVVAARLPSAPRNPVVRAQRSAPPTKTAASTGETSNLATTMSSLVKAPLPYEPEAPIECDPRWGCGSSEGTSVLGCEGGQMCRSHASLGDERRCVPQGELAHPNCRPVSGYVRARSGPDGGAPCRGNQARRLLVWVGSSATTGVGAHFRRAAPPREVVPGLVEL